MKKIVLTFGIISGLISGSLCFIMAPGEGEVPDFANGHLYGYATMIIALSTIFFAVKQYRDKYNDSVIKFGKAFLIGLYITMVAGVIYSICWEAYLATSGNDFIDQYMEYSRNQMAEGGMSIAEINAEMEPQMEMVEKYKTNTPFRMGLTFLEILPVGLIISLISAGLFSFVLKKKE
ncbi:MAG: DUF4199 domain-containing protein [Saprospiraceae bacterium]